MRSRLPQSKAVLLRCRELRRVEVDAPDRDAGKNLLRRFRESLDLDSRTQIGEKGDRHAYTMRQIDDAEATCFQPPRDSGRRRGDQSTASDAEQGRIVADQNSAAIHQAQREAGRARARTPGQPTAHSARPEPPDLA